MELNRYSNDNIRKVKYQKEVDKIYSVSIVDKWNNPPMQARVNFHSGVGNDSSEPLKIYKRKNCTHYVIFRGKRYNIDINDLSFEQFVS